MGDEEAKESRPPGLDEPTDPDLPQEPGIPGRKAEEDGPEQEPAAPSRGFPEDAGPA